MSCSYKILFFSDIVAYKILESDSEQTSKSQESGEGGTHQAGHIYLVVFLLDILCVVSGVQHLALDSPPKCSFSGVAAVSLKKGVPHSMEP